MRIGGEEYNYSLFDCSTINDFPKTNKMANEIALEKLKAK
jgi:hypothetical protein